MKIAIDIDNVLTNTTECVIDYINERLNIGLKMEDLTSYWIENNIDAQYEWIAEMAFNDKTMWKNVQMIEGAAEVIEKLYNESHEIYFATATTAENFRKKIGFLKRNLPFLPDDYVRMHAISIKHKQLLNVDVLIDDYLNNLIGEKSYVSIVYDYPWNRGAGFHPEVRPSEWFNMKRVSNWQEIYNIIQQLEQSKLPIEKKKVKVNVIRTNGIKCNNK